MSAAAEAVIATEVKDEGKKEEEAAVAATVPDETKPDATEVPAAKEEESAAEKAEPSAAEEPAVEKTEEPAAEKTEEPTAEKTEEPAAPEEESAAPEKTPATLVVAEEGDSDTSTTLGRDDTVLTAGSMTEPEAVAAVVAEAAPGSVRIKVICDMTQPGDVVGIVGEDEALGSWDTAKMLTLSTSAAEFPTWFADVPSVAVAKEFKFVLLRADGGVTWEPIRFNRKLDGTSVSSPAMFGSSP